MQRSRLQSPKWALQLFRLGGGHLQGQRYADKAEQEADSDHQVRGAGEDVSEGKMLAAGVEEDVVNNVPGYTDSLKGGPQ